MDRYTEKQRQAAKIVAEDLKLKVFNFHHNIDDTQIVLDIAATTNPQLKVFPLATNEHSENWNAEQQNNTEQNVVLYKTRILSFDKEHPFGKVKAVYEYIKS